MSRATRMRAARVKRAKAAPTARHNEASSCSGTVPRMSYALKTVSSEGMSAAQPSGVPSDQARSGGGFPGSSTEIPHQNDSRRRVVGAAGGEAADAEDVPQHAQRVASDPHARLRGVGQLDRHLPQ